MLPHCRTKDDAARAALAGHRACSGPIRDVGLSAQDVPYPGPLDSWMMKDQERWTSNDTTGPGKERRGEGAHHPLATRKEPNCNVTSIREYACDLCVVPLIFLPPFIIFIIIIIVSLGGSLPLEIAASWLNS